jgi:hypothetical protein
VDTRRSVAPRLTPIRPSAGDLLARVRSRRGERAGAVPIVRSVEPSRAAWGEPIVVTGDFAPDASVRVFLRVGGQVFALAGAESDPKSVRATLPDPPPGSADPVIANLFVVIARESSRACRLTMSRGPVLRRIVRVGDDEWLLDGTGFGTAADHVQVKASGSPEVQLLSVSNTELRVRATLARRSSVRVSIGDRISNPLQVME